MRLTRFQLHGAPRPGLVVPDHDAIVELDGLGDDTVDIISAWDQERIESEAASQ